MNTKLIACSLFALILAPGCAQDADSFAHEGIAEVSQPAQASEPLAAGQGVAFSEFSGDSGSCAAVSLDSGGNSDVCVKDATGYDLVNRPDGRCADLVASVAAADDTVYRPAGTFCNDGGKPTPAKTAGERAAQLIPATIQVMIKNGKRVALNATGLKFETSNGMVEILDAPDCFLDLDYLEQAIEDRKNNNTDDQVSGVTYTGAVHLEDNTTLCNGSGKGCMVVL